MLWFLSLLWPGLRPLTFEELYSKDVKHSLKRPGSNTSWQQEVPTLHRIYGSLRVSGARLPHSSGYGSGYLSRRAAHFWVCHPAICLSLHWCKIGYEHQPHHLNSQISYLHHFQLYSSVDLRTFRRHCATYHHHRATEFLSCWKTETLTH